VVAGA